MKIAHVMTRFSPADHPGGVERVVKELASRQAEQHEVEIICRNEFDDKHEEEMNGVKIKRASCIDRDLVRTPSSFYTMRKLIREADAEIFHIHDWSPYLNYMLAGKPAKHVLTLHNLSVGLQKHFEGFATKNASNVTCVSKWLTEQIEERHGIETHTVRDGVNPDNFENNNEEGYALFVGSLIESKGIKETCEVFETQEIPLKVAGTGPLKEELQEKYSHEFHGYVTDEKLRELYSKCNYFVMPSRREGFGLVWAEAMASGKPVIATKTGLGAEIPEYCGEKLGIDYRNENLEDAIERMNTRSFESERICSYVKEKLSWKEISQEYLKIYRKIQDKPER